MYLFHEQIIYFVVLNLNEKINNVVLFAIVFVLTIVGSSIIAWILDKFWVASYLVGKNK